MDAGGDKMNLRNKNYRVREACDDMVRRNNIETTGDGDGTPQKRWKGDVR